MLDLLSDFISSCMAALSSRKTKDEELAMVPLTPEQQDSRLAHSIRNKRCNNILTGTLRPEDALEDSCLRQCRDILAGPQVVPG